MYFLKVASALAAQIGLLPQHEEGVGSSEGVTVPGSSTSTGRESVGGLGYGKL